MFDKGGQLFGPHPELFPRLPQGFDAHFFDLGLVVADDDREARSEERRVGKECRL